MARRALALAVVVLVASAVATAASVWLASRQAVAAAGFIGLGHAIGLAWLLHRQASASDEAGDGSRRHAAAAPHPHHPQYRRVVEQVDQVLFEVDRDLRWTFLNPAWRVLIGDDPESTLGQPLTGRLHPDDQRHVEQMCATVLSGQRDEDRAEVRFVTRTGTICWCDLRLHALRPEGAILGMAGTLADITRRRLVQQELERARQAAEQANSAKTEFLRSMSHEMRTPLNGVLGLMELLGATRLDAQQSRYVAVARASATHLSTLISDILDLSRIETGTFRLDRTLFLLPELIESSLDPIRPDAGAKRLRLSCIVAPDVPRWVFGDAGRLRQVLVTLLANAVKFTDVGQVHLRAGADVDLATRRATLRLEVEDTGIGMSAEQIGRLFLPFSPADASSARRHSGTGLGLTICKRLVDAMQGTIDVRSVEHAGATFLVTLPIDIADAAMVEAHHGQASSLRVIAVIADEQERQAVSRLLDGWRFDAAVVADTDVAWGHLQATSVSPWRFGVVLLDAAMPAAPDLARQIPALPRPPGVVWLTRAGGGLPADVPRVREQVTRPIEAAALFDAIMQAEVSATAASDTLGPTTWTQPPRVLVAEDHAVNQIVVRDLLTSMGCQVEVVADGEAAVQAVTTRPFDVVLMDCQMPVLDGIEATRRLRQAQAAGMVPHPPKVIALTANATGEDRQVCLDAGMDAYLTKPVRGAVLQRTLQRLLADDAALMPTAPAPESRAAEFEAPLPDVPDAEDILDPVEVLLRCNHNADIGARMLQLFAESLPAELEALEMAVAANDREAIARVTHKMRGAAATLAATRLAGAITGIELFLKHGDGGPLSELVTDVRHESALLLGVVPHTCRRLLESSPSPRGHVADPDERLR